jgi:predicted Zn-dependent protease
MSERTEQIKIMLLEEPDDIFLNYALGLELLSQKKYKDSMQQFLQVLKLDATHVAAWQQLAQISAETGSPTQAIDYAHKGVEAAQAKGDRKAAGELLELIAMLEE